MTEEQLFVEIIKEAGMGKTGFDIQTLLQHIQNIQLYALLENCVAAHCNIVIGGSAPELKMELLQHLSFSIAPDESISLYEDNQQFNHDKINLMRKCHDYVADKDYSHSQFIKAALKMNTSWTLLPQLQEPDMQLWLGALSTGMKFITAMELDDAEKLPDRVCSGIQNTGCDADAEHINRAVYDFIDVVVLVDYAAPGRPQITQAAFYDRENGTNTCTVLYDRENGKNLEQIPERLSRRFLKSGTDD